VSLLLGNKPSLSLCQTLTVGAASLAAAGLDLRLMVRKPQLSTGFVTRLFNYGSLYHLFSDDSAALQRSLERAVNEDSDDKESWSNLGCLLFNKAEYARAEACFERAVKIDRSDAHSWSLDCAAAYRIIDVYSECCVDHRC